MRVFIGRVDRPTYGQWCELDDAEHYSMCLERGLVDGPTAEAQFAGRNEFDAVEPMHEVAITDVEGPRFLRFVPIDELEDWKRWEDDEDLLETIAGAVGDEFITPDMVRDAIVIDDAADYFAEANEVANAVARYLDGDAIKRDMMAEGWAETKDGRLVWAE